MTLIAKIEYEMILIAKRFKTYVFLFLGVFEPFLREVVFFFLGTTMSLWMRSLNFFRKQLKHFLS